MTQKEMFEAFMKIAHGHTAGIIKGALANSFLAVLCSNSSNVDEAIVQWNELSLFFEKEVRQRFKSTILKANGLGDVTLYFNGDTNPKL